MERILETLKIVHHITPDERTGDGNAVEGTGIDTAGYDEAAFLIGVGGTNGTVDFKVQHSDNNSTWADITGAAITQLTSGDDNKTASINVRLGGRANRRRYVRGVLTVENTKVADTVALVLLKAQRAPVTNSPASVLV